MKASIASSLVTCRAGLDLAAAIGVEGGLGEDLAGQADAGAHLGPVVGMAHIVEEDQRLVARVGGAQADPAAALRAHRADMRLEAVLGGQRTAVIGHGEREEVVLDVGVADAGAGADEAAALEMVGGTQPLLEEEPAQADQGLGPGVHRAVERDRLAAGDLEVEFQMVLQVLAHAGEVVRRPRCRGRAARTPGRCRRA